MSSRSIYLGGLGDDSPPPRPSPKQARDRANAWPPEPPRSRPCVLRWCRKGQRGLRDHRRPRRPAARDDHAELGLDADPADRARGIAATSRASARTGPTLGRRFDVGGPEVMTYRQMIERIASPARPTTVDRRGAGADAEAVLALAPSRHPGRRAVARPLIEGLRNPTVVREERLRSLLPVRAQDVRRSGESGIRHA